MLVQSYTPTLLRNIHLFGGLEVEGIYPLGYTAAEQVITFPGGLDVV